MPKLRPLDPIFNPPVKYGAIDVGNSPGSITSLSVGSDFTTNTLYSLSGSGFTIDLPANTAVGDILICVCDWANSVVPGLPTDFTNLHNAQNVGGNSFRVSYKVADGTEPSSYTISGASGGGSRSVAMARIAGATLGPTSNTGIETADPLIEAPSITMSYTGLVFHWVAARDDGPFAPEDGQTEVVDIGESTGAQSGIWIGTIGAFPGATGVLEASVSGGATINRATGLIGGWSGIHVGPQDP